MYLFIIIINCKWICTRWQWYYNTQYNTQKHKRTQKSQNNTYTLKIIHNAIITNTVTQTQCTKGNRSIKKYDKRTIYMYNYPNMI